MRKRRQFSDQFIRKEALGDCAIALKTFILRRDILTWGTLDQAAFTRVIDEIAAGLLKRKANIERRMV